jgi:hypothetical protein
MPFEHLRDYRDGELWDALLLVRPEPLLTLDMAPEEGFVRDQDGRPSVVYHYTTAAGMRGILESNCIWASAAYYLNDSSEIEYGCRLVLDVIAEWRRANLHRESFSVHVLEGLERFFSDPRSRLSRSSSIYIACFCKNGNLLSQWRAYGQAGGYSLGFEVSPGTINLEIPGGFWDLRLAEVVYSERWQRSLINSLLVRAFQTIGEHLVEGEVQGQQRGPLSVDVVLCLQDRLLEQIVTFKNPAFREEGEWRLVARPNLLRARVGQQPQEGDSPLKFRVSRGSLVPYLELLPKEGKIPLKSVRYGPSLEGSRVENPVRMMLTVNGFPDVDVTGSKLPVIL